MKNITDYFRNGLIVHLNGDSFDGGDTAQRMGSYYSAFEICKKFEIDQELPFTHQDDIQKAYSQLELSPGLWRRHPDQYSDPSDFSRDQQLPIQCALLFQEDKLRLKNLIFKQWKNFGKYQNKDFRIYEWTLDFRCLNYWFLWPLMMILDLGLLVNVLLRWMKNRHNPDDVGDDLNLTIILLTCFLKYPTPLSILAFYLYPKLINIQKSWDWYFRQPEAPPLNDIWRPIINRL